MKYPVIRDLLFLLPPEAAHHLSLQALSAAAACQLTSLLAPPPPADPVQLMGLTFPNRVGLAAGLDKDARCIDGLAALGFGHIEVGTVTPRPQPGNASPRLFRLPKHKALINRLGFNNAGVEAMVESIRHARYDGILGVNIGKNASTPADQALEDYKRCLRAVYGVASYVTVNISSPNTPGLRALQEGEQLPRLLAALKEEGSQLAQRHGRQVPLLVKIAPDLSDEALRGLAARLLEFAVEGVIVGNTTLARDSVTGTHADETGGLSGAPLLDRANHALEVVASEVKGKLALIGVGGITQGEDAARKVSLGADLVQLYTGFIYAGPALIEQSVRAIRALAANEPK